MRTIASIIVALALLSSVSQSQLPRLVPVVTKYSSATLLNGTSQYWTKASPSGFDLNGYQVMVAAVVRPTNFATGGFYVARYQSVAGGRQLELNQGTDGKVKFWVSVDGSTSANRETGSALVVNRWYLVVGTYTPSALNVYVNGALDNGTLTGSVPASLTNAAGIALNVGDNSNVDAEFFSGYIAHVQVVRFTTLPTDIASIVSRLNATWRTQGFPGAYAGGQIVAWYDWRSSGTDKSGQGNHLAPVQRPPILNVIF